ncbi:S8 family serine peptidase [Telluribacter sp. SYSU D00476]|uniref:S8 family serine peptidase n=1 Tax=Telluribacter sp. SYSU D00476 TaxID=2811430 RepID=UPI001FF1098D|nr:S8 family serine peptidase [Telluribacter sp. SYSU D00476]
MSIENYSLTVGGTQVPLKKVEDVRLVTPARDEHPATVASRLGRSTRLAIDPTYPPELLIVRGEKQKLQEMKSYPDIRNTRAAFQDPEGNVFVLTNDILISFKEGASEQEREKVLEKVDGVVIEKGPDYWKFRVNDPEEDAPLLLANELAAEDIVEYAEPNSVQAPTFHFPQDAPRFISQWHLRNTGQGGGTAGADVNALGAWAITTGSPTIRVVVHDTGVDINHPDLVANIDPGRDFDNNDNDATNNGDAHGTACAGVIAAAENGLGVVGIAPNCRIVPLRAAGAHTWDTWAQTFDWAAQRGQIISCSWSITPNNTLTAAIRRAVNNGVTVFCATGNGGTNTVSYPASLPETIGVGASTNRDVRSGYSQYGNGLDFVAPSSGGTLRIETTDVRGAFGYNTNPNGDYCQAADASGFGGTSSATPLAAGVAALMLSVDPGLRPEGIRYLLQGSATKVASAAAAYDVHGRSNQYGYGRINAALAVQRARPLQLVMANFGYNAGGWRVDQHPRIMADVTGDGRDDIVGFGNAGVWVSRNNGNGTFQAPQMVVANFGYSAGGWRVDQHPRFMADVTGDGRADILGFGNAGVWVSRNNGNGTFQAPQMVMDNFGYNAGGWRVDMHPRFMVDVTGDGRSDIVGFGTAGVWVSRNNGNGTFQAPQLVVANFGYGQGWRVDQHPRLLADTTGDGRPDIVGFGNAGVFVSRNNGDGTFQAPQLVMANFGYSAGSWRVDQHPRFMTDVTGDGRADIVGFGNAGVWVSRNNGDGTFQAPQMVVPNFGYHAGGWRVDQHPRFMADMSGNGRADIVGFGTAGTWVSFNNGDGTFKAPQMVVANYGYAQGWRVDQHPRFLAKLTGDKRADIIGFGNAGAWFRNGLHNLLPTLLIPIEVVRDTQDLKPV